MCMLRFFFNNSFIEIHFIYLNINPFKVHNLVVFSVLTGLCNNHHYPILEHFVTPKETLYPLVVRILM